VIHGTLGSITLEFENKATVCKYIVPEGYPTNPAAGQKIELDESKTDALVFHASIDQKEDGLYMTTSRAIGFVGIADGIGEAERIAESAIKAVKGPVFHREDIGTKELLEKRIRHMEELKTGSSQKAL
jgi:phosphoribosylamine--glycine ligase